jgi:8-oxo-dGTP pyrophosphatase MutT (NUDIX family)
LEPKASADILERLGGALRHAALPWTGEGAQAAVLVAITDESVPKVLLGRRAMHLRLHPGEVAFAGGKREPDDPSPWATAVREAGEEVGINEEQVTPIGELAPLMTRTGFEVHPCIARVPARLVLTVDPGEFDSIFWRELAIFADRDIFRMEAMSDGEHTIMVPHYQVEQDNIWGVTAAVLAQLANMALDAGLDLKRDWKMKP